MQLGIFLVELRFGSNAIANIAMDRHEVGASPSLVENRENARFHPKLRTVFAIIEQLGFHGFPASECRTDFVEFEAIGFRPLEDARCFTENFVAGVAGNAGKGIVDVGDARTGCLKWLGLSNEYRFVNFQHHRLE